jgi:lipopolysaccharide export system protein LptA
MPGHRIVYTNTIEKTKHLLLIGIVVMFAVMGFYVWRYEPPVVKPEPITTVSEADVVVHGVELVEYMHDRTLWQLWAEEASIYSKTKTTHLVDVSADFFDDHGIKSMHVVSDRGIKDDASGNITASGNVEADAVEEGIHLKTEELVYDAETQLITSETHVEITRGNSITEGEGLKSDLHLDKVRILRDVESRLSMPDPLAPPVIIAADALQLNHGAQIATYTGHVVATQGTSEMRANLMHVYLNNPGEGGESLEGINRIEVFGDVRVTQEGMMATGEKGEYTHFSQTVVLTGTPEKQAYAEDAATNRSIQADLIRLYLTTNDFEGEGNVKISVLSGGLPGVTQEN